MHFNELLSHLSVSAIDEGAFAGLGNLQFLDLSHNKLRHLIPRVFQPLTKLCSLQLRSNYLNRLEADVFEGLSQLNTLSLIWNKLSNITQPVFSSLEDLETLSLNHNPIMLVTASAFCGLNSLQTLYLSSTSPFTLTKQMFRLNSDITSVRSIKPNITCNPLQNLSNFYCQHGDQLAIEPGFTDGLSCLHTVGLQSNKISTLLAKTFAASPSIRCIDLSYNHIVYVHPMAFAGLNNIQEIWMHSNKIALLERWVNMEESYILPEDYGIDQVRYA